jgi:hypothetical protein
MFRLRSTILTDINDSGDNLLRVSPILATEKIKDTHKNSPLCFSFMYVGLYVFL